MVPYSHPSLIPPTAQSPRAEKSNVALIVVLLLAGVFVVGGIGCVSCLYLIGRNNEAKTAAQKTVVIGGQKGPPPPTSSASPPPPQQPLWITSERPFVKFLPPPGWTKNIKGDWGVFTSPSGAAVYAFTTFSQPNESTSRLAKAAWVLGVGDIRWGTPVWGTIGRDHFRAHMGEGTCNGPGGYIWYATANSGTTEQMLLIYTVSARGTKADKDAVLASIGSLQRR